MAAVLSMLVPAAAVIALPPRTRARLPLLLTLGMEEAVAARLSGDSAVGRDGVVLLAASLDRLARLLTSGIRSACKRAVWAVEEVVMSCGEMDLAPS